MADIVKQQAKSVEIPKVDVSPVADVSCPRPPINSEFTLSYIRSSDKLPFAVAIHEPDTYGRTHTAKNSALFWQGTALEFRQLFEKP